MGGAEHRDGFPDTEVHHNMLRDAGEANHRLVVPALSTAARLPAGLGLKIRQGQSDPHTS
jgi:hypothetical protein